MALPEDPIKRYVQGRPRGDDLTSEQIERAERGEYKMIWDKMATPGLDKHPDLVEAEKSGVKDAEWWALTDEHSIHRFGNSIGTALSKLFVYAVALITGRGDLADRATEEYEFRQGRANAEGSYAVDLSVLERAERDARARENAIARGDKLADASNALGKEFETARVDQSADPAKGHTPSFGVDHRR